MKTCRRCQTEKPAGDFYASSRGYLSSNCKPCHNAIYAAKKAALRAPGRPNLGLTTEEELTQRKAAYQRRKAIERLRAGKFVGDGPCWCCRKQAAGATPYRLCIICAG